MFPFVHVCIPIFSYIKHCLLIILLLLEIQHLTSCLSSSAIPPSKQVASHSLYVFTLPHLLSITFSLLLFLEGISNRLRTRHLRRSICRSPTLLHALPPQSFRPRKDVQFLHGNLAILLRPPPRSKPDCSVGVDDGRGRGDC